MKWLPLALLLGCSMSKSAERQDEFAQQAETRRDEGPWTREVWEWVGSVDDVPSPVVGTGTSIARQRVEIAQNGIPPAAAANRTGKEAQQDSEHGPLLRHIVEKHDPVVTTTQTQTTASGEAHTASASRFGFSPWQWAIGAAVLAALAYGAFWVKRKLGF